MGRTRALGVVHRMAGHKVRGRIVAWLGMNSRVHMHRANDSAPDLRHAVAVTAPLCRLSVPGFAMGVLLTLAMQLAVLWASRYRWARELLQVTRG